MCTVHVSLKEHAVYEGVSPHPKYINACHLFFVLFRDPGVTQRSIRWEDENKGTVLMHSAQPRGLRSKGGGAGGGNAKLQALNLHLIHAVHYFPPLQHSN